MNSYGPRVLIADAAGQVADPAFTAAAHHILHSLVAGGAALGWVDPPSVSEVSELLQSVAAAVPAGDAALCAAYSPAPGEPATPSPSPPGQLIGLGYWTRYERPTHRRHADLRRIAVAAHAQGHGAGRALTQALIESAAAAGIEMLTLDARGDNMAALHLYRSLGFTEYGRLKDFVTFGGRRYDTVFCVLDLRPDQRD